MAQQVITLAINADGTAKVVRDAQKIKGSWLDTAAKLTIVWQGVSALFSKVSAVMAKPIAAAAQFTKDSAQLNQALKRITPDAENIRKQFDGFADSMQRTAGVSLDTVTSLQKTFVQLTNNTESANKASEAALALSSAVGIDVNTAMRGLAQTLDGSAGLLGRYVPALRNMTKEQLRSGAAIELVAEQFGTALAANMETSIGQWERLTNIIGDRYLENASLAFLQNRKLAVALEAIGDELIKAAPSVEDMAQAFADSAEWALKLLKVLVAIGSAGVSSILDIADAMLKASSATLSFLEMTAPTEKGKKFWQDRIVAVEEMRMKIFNARNAAEDFGIKVVEALARVEKKVAAFNEKGGILGSVVHGPNGDKKIAEKATANIEDFSNSAKESLIKAKIAHNEFWQGVEAQEKAAEQLNQQLIGIATTATTTLATGVGDTLAGMATGALDAAEAFQQMSRLIVTAVIDAAVNSITAYAASSAAASYFSQAGIPVIGPILAGAAAAVAGAFVKGLVSRVGRGKFFGGVVMEGVAHRDSVMVPARKGETFRTPEQEKALRRHLSGVPMPTGAGMTINISPLAGQMSNAQWDRIVKDQVIPSLRRQRVVA